MKKRKIVYLFPLTALFLSGCSLGEVKHAIGESWVGQHLLHPIYDPIRDLVTDSDKNQSGNNQQQEQKDDATALLIKSLVGVPAEINQGETLSASGLSAVVVYSNGKEKTEAVTKVELDTSVVGEATGKAFVGELLKEFTINVVAAGEKVDVTGIRYTLEPKKYTIEVNETIQLSIEVEPENATNKKVNYEFSTEGIVSIENGIIKGLKEGKTDITITSDSNPEVKKTISGFTVKKSDAAVPNETAAGFELFTEGTLKNGETINITAINGDSILGMGPLSGTFVEPVNLSVDTNGKLVVGEALNYKALLNNDGTYSLKDSNGKFLSLASSGNNISIKDAIDDDCKFNIGHGENGTTTIVGANSAKDARFLVYNSNNPRFSFYKQSTAVGYPQLIVYHDGQEAEKKAVTGVEFLEELYEVEATKSVSVVARVLPTDATDQEVTYSLKNVSPEGCVTIAGNVVTGVTEGTATVVATSHDGNYTAEANLVVIEKKTTAHTGTLENPFTAQDACIIAADLPSEQYTKEYYYIKGVVTSKIGEFDPSYGNFTFMLDEVFEAYRMKNGPEFAMFTSEDDIKVGDTVILYAQIKNFKGTYETGGGYVYAINPAAVTGVTLSDTELSLELGSAPVTLTATVAPENAVNKAVTWESSNLEVATVTNGVITAVGEGSATITVKTVEGNFTASCTVTVTPATKTLTSISVTGPTKTTYTEGEKLDLTGLVVTAHYDDQSSEVIEVGYTTNIALDKALELTDTSLVISYGGKTAESITLTINKAVAIIAPGTYYIQSGGKYLAANSDSSKQPLAVDNVDLATPFDFILQENTIDQYKLKVHGESNYLYLTATNNGVKIGSTDMVWTITQGTAKNSSGELVTGGYNLTATDSKNAVRVLTFYESGLDFRCYTLGEDGQASNRTDNTFVEKYIEKTLDSISVASQPTKTSYYVGDTLDTTGLVVKAHYVWENNGSEDVEISDYTLSVSSPFTTEDIGTKTITVTYGGKTATFDVVVEARAATLTSITIDGEPETTTYDEGEAYSTAGLTVTAHYSDDSTSDITASVTITINKITAAVGDNSITYSVEYEQLSATKNVNVIVNEVVRASLPHTATFSFSSGSPVLTDGWEGTGEAYYSTAYSFKAENEYVKAEKLFEAMSSIKVTVKSIVNSQTADTGRVTISALNDAGEVVSSGVIAPDFASVSTADAALKAATEKSATLSGTNITGVKVQYTTKSANLALFSVEIRDPSAALSVESVSLDQTTLNMETGSADVQLVATTSPTEAVAKSTTWSSDHPEVATVNNGLVHAVAAGTANITVTVDGKTATCVVTVTAPLPETSSVASVDCTNSISDSNVTVLSAAYDTKNYCYGDKGTAGTTINSFTYKSSTALWTNTPVATVFKAVIGGGSARDKMTYPVEVVLLDASGNEITGTKATITQSVKTKGGDTYEIVLANVGSVYGFKVTHMKEDSWNARYFSFDLQIATAK